MKKVNLYIIDDQEEAVLLLRRLFKPNKRYNVKSYTRVRDLLKNVELFPPHIVICDYLMPEMSGIELLRLLKERFPDVRNILITGELFGPEVIQGMEKGVFEIYFSKPWNNIEFQETVSRLAREVAKEG